MIFGSREYYRNRKRFEREICKFANVCDWLVDKRLSIHFEEDITK